MLGLRRMMRVELLVLLLGCSSRVEPAPSSEGPVIGGFDATDKAFDAIGVIGIKLPSPNGSEMFQPVCTGTLIAPTAVLTAKHCVRSDEAPETLLMEEAPFYFALGKDAKAPERLVRVVSFRTTPGGKLAWIGGPEELGAGSDVALLLLEQPITDVAPMKVATGPLTPNEVGSVVTVVGFGLSNPDDFSSLGHRRAGALPLRATSGSPMKTLFGSFDEYFAHQRSAFKFPEASREMFARLWEKPVLEGYEAFAGGRPSDATTCFGDSGGPVLLREGSDWVVRGVVSYGLPTATAVCGGGDFFANFGPEAQALLAERDQGCLGLSDKGLCVGGSLAIQCGISTSPVVEDCSTAGLTCGLDERGVARCSAHHQPRPPRSCNRIGGEGGSPVIPQLVAADAPAPSGGPIADGTYALESETRYTGASGATGAVEGEDGRATLVVAGRSIQAASVMEHLPGLPYGHNPSVTIEILERGAGYLTVKSTCPTTTTETIYYTANGDRLTFYYYYDFFGSVRAATYKLATGT